MSARRSFFFCVCFFFLAQAPWFGLAWVGADALLPWGEEVDPSGGLWLASLLRKTAASFFVSEWAFSLLSAFTLSLAIASLLKLWGRIGSAVAWSGALFALVVLQLSLFRGQEVFTLGLALCIGVLATHTCLSSYRLGVQSASLGVIALAAWLHPWVLALCGVQLARDRRELGAWRKYRFLGPVFASASAFAWLSFDSPRLDGWNWLAGVSGPLFASGLLALGLWATALFGGARVKGEWRHARLLVIALAVLSGLALHVATPLAGEVRLRWRAPLALLQQARAFDLFHGVQAVFLEDPPPGWTELHLRTYGGLSSIDARGPQHPWMQIKKLDTRLGLLVLLVPPGEVRVLVENRTSLTHRLVGKTVSGKSFERELETPPAEKGYMALTLRAEPLDLTTLTLKP